MVGKKLFGATVSDNFYSKCHDSKMSDQETPIACKPMSKAKIYATPKQRGTSKTLDQKRIEENEGHSLTSLIDDSFRQASATHVQNHESNCKVHLHKKWFAKDESQQCRDNTRQFTESTQTSKA